MLISWMFWSRKIRVTQNRPQVVSLGGEDEIYATQFQDNAMEESVRPISNREEEVREEVGGEGKARVNTEQKFNEVEEYSQRESGSGIPEMQSYLFIL